MNDEYYQATVKRVNETPALRRYRSILLQYQMNQKHLRWVATADIEEVLDWCRYRRAERRVDRSPRLEPYRDILLYWDWANMDDHLEWVATAPLREILNWCETVKASEE